VVGVAEKQGDTLTSLILTADTDRVITHSTICSAMNKKFQTSSRADFRWRELDNKPRPILQLTSDLLDIDPTKLKLAKFSHVELMGIAFLRDTDDSQMFIAEVIRKIQDMNAGNHKNINFLCGLGESQFDEILTYQELSNTIEVQHH
jgi:hypothetical protein